MKLLVTGGMGEVGKPVIRWLLSKGFKVRVLDLHCEEIPGADCRVGNVKDYALLGQHMQGIDGVVHLAAYRHPGLAHEVELLDVNIQGTINVFRAAADAGINRVVCASSINALGYNFGIKFPPGQLQYFPLDEEHPLYITDPYSFSKYMIEQVGAYFWRREGITSTFLRFPAVYDMDTGQDSIITQFVQSCYIKTKELLDLPKSQCDQRVNEIIMDWERRAKAREWELAFDLSFPDAHVMFGRSNFWTSLDARDAALAIYGSLTSDISGSHPLYITDSRNFVGLPSQTLAEVFFPEVPIHGGCLSGDASLVSIARAQELIGFEPAYPFSA